MLGPFAIFQTLTLLWQKTWKIFPVPEGCLCFVAGTTGYDSSARRYLPLTT
jgi:hypothetical protein